MRITKNKDYYLKEKIMKINLGKNKDLELDLNKITSIMLVGIFGTGKSRTVKEILKQAREEYANLDILYVDDHKEDFKEVNSTVKDLLNVGHTLTEPELKSLHDVVISQQKFRNQLLRGKGVTTLDELVGKEVQTFVIGDREYMPDDIIWHLEDGQQKWLLAHEYYDKKMKEVSSFFIEGQSVGEYHPTRLLLCFDEFYTSDMSEEGQKLVHDIAHSIIRFGRVTHQNIILTTQRLSQHKEYGDIYKLSSALVFFHSGFDNKDEYRVLFDKELPRDMGRGDVTFKTPFSTSIKEDSGVVSKLWEAVDNIWVGSDFTEFSLSDIRALTYILKKKLIYLNNMFERRFLHIIEVVRELDFSDCIDIDVSWHYAGKEVYVSVLIDGLSNDYSISVKMLNMSDEDLIKNKEFCKHIGGIDMPLKTVI